MAGVGLVSAVPCCATWVGAGLAASAEPAPRRGAALVWVAGQEERVEKEAVEEFWGRWCSVWGYCRAG